MSMKTGTFIRKTNCTADHFGVTILPQHKHDQTPHVLPHNSPTAVSHRRHSNASRGHGLAEPGIEPLILLLKDDPTYQQSHRRPQVLHRRLSAVWDTLEPVPLNTPSFLGLSGGRSFVSPARHSWVWVLLHRTHCKTFIHKCTCW